MFEKTETGDKVFIRVNVEVRGGWTPLSLGSFYVPRLITRTTPKYVCIGSNTYCRTNGKQRGGNGWIYREGELVSGGFGRPDKPVIDESADYEKAVNKVENINIVRLLLDTRGKRYDIDWVGATEEQLFAVIKSVESLPKLAK